MLLSSCSALFPGSTTTEERIASFPTTHLELREPVEIRWNKFLVPYVTAQNNHDLAYSLGLIQGHLRGTQIQFVKRIAHARLSELGGPFTNDIDHALKLIDFPRAAADAYKSLPPFTKEWVDAFAAGINHVMLHGKPPKDLGLYNMQPEPITPQDIIAIGRVIGSDINWGRYITLMRERHDNPEKWQQTFADALDLGYGTTSSLSFLDRVSKSGSNSYAIAPAKSASGGALLISDPHLGFTLPNAWLLVGIKSPDFQAVGGMAPALPFIAFGRNPTLAWGGTNMRSASSDLFRISEKDIIDTKTIELKNRFWYNKTIQVRNSTLGPVVSDHPLFPAKKGEIVALRWKGHEISDEISAFLNLNRASKATDVPQALQDFSVSGQHIVVADSQGNIGHIPAVHLPKRPFVTPPDLVLDPIRHQWQGYFDSSTIDTQFNPKRGYVMSSNDQPEFVSQTLGYYFSVPDRSARLTELLEPAQSVTLDRAKQLQTDSISPYSRRLAKEIVQTLNQHQLDTENKEFVQRLANWDGNYDKNQQTPVVFEMLLYRLAYTIYSDKLNEDDKLPRPFNDLSWLVDRFPADLAAILPDMPGKESLNQVIAKAKQDTAEFPTWGDMHWLRSGPIQANVPVVGRLFTSYAFPVSGSRQTLMKTFHNLGNKKHNAFYGSQSRHISDLSDPNTNYFTLLGGQDGWLGSENYADQIPLWQQSEYIQMPLERDKIVEQFQWVTTLIPNQSN